MEVVSVPILGILTILGFLLCLGYWVLVLFRVDQMQKVTSTPVQANDGTSSKARFKELLEEAQFSMIIYDDGDMVSDSIYMDPEITELVKRKLENSRSFRMRCLFNVDDPNSLFRKALENYTPQMEIRIRDQDKPRLAIHYKIIDDGTKAYLSRHSPGSRNRRYRIVDCTTVSKYVRNHVATVVLGKYTHDFQQAFDTAKAAS